MPLLSAFIGSLFTALGTFLAKLFLAKLAIRVVAVVALTTCASVLMVTFNNQVSPLVAQAFNTGYGALLGLAFPPVAGTCLAAIATIWSACGLYSLNKRAIEVTAGI